MRELWDQVTGGWKLLTADGKYMALLFGVLLFFWYGRLRGRTGTPRKETEGGPAASGRASAGKEISAGERLMRYTTLLTALIAVPVTAVFLRLYQTGFYDFVWVLAFLPMTAALAYGFAGIYSFCLEKYAKRNFLKAAGLAALLLALVLLCGDLSTGGEEATEAERMRETEQILVYLRESGNTENICLWGPVEVMDYVRGLDGRVRLLYGRNMWEPSLNAYSYDVYSGEITEAYQWMEGNELFLEGFRLEPYEPEKTAEMLRMARRQGVNWILFSQGRLPEAEEALSGLLLDAAKEAGITMTKERTGGYSVWSIADGEG